MKKLSFLSVLFLALLMTVTSCKDEKASTAAVPTPATTTPTATPAANAQTATATKAIPTGPTTTMTFEETKHDFGKIMDGDKVEHIFKFKNTGKEPLVISNAKGSCGCTAPIWPKEPIKPGDTGEIKVVYNSKNKGKVGGKPENKNVTITANTNPVETRLFMTGIVDKKAAPAATKTTK